MTRPEATSLRRPLSMLILAALTLALLPIGIFAAILAARDLAALSGTVIELDRLAIVMLPLLMWLAALLTAAFAVHKLVVRPITAIQTVIEAYGKGADAEQVRSQLLALDHGSREVSSLADSFCVMADDLAGKAEQLRTALDEQSRLTRELHHRVKNNLQIVASLLSLQARAADKPEIAETYAHIQARIAALIQVHRWIYDDWKSDGVDLYALVRDLCAGLETSLGAAGKREVSVPCKAAPLSVPTDIAVPVAFLITELASLAALHAPPGPVEIAVETIAGATANSITVTSAAFIGIDHIAATNMAPPARIILGMARQLRSSLDHDAVTGTYTVQFGAQPC